MLKQACASQPLSLTDRILNISGGVLSATSLRQLTAWCDDRFGQHEVVAKPENRPFDIPWMVLDSSKASKLWNWQPDTTRHQILEEIARHAEANPDWLDLSAPL